MKKKAIMLAGVGAISMPFMSPGIAGSEPVAEVQPEQQWPGYCMDTADVLCVFDGGTWAYGQFYDANSSWNLGPGNNWNNRADVFQNNRSNRDACVFSGENASGVVRRVPKFEERSWSNFGSSNKWVAVGAACS